MSSLITPGYAPRRKAKSLDDVPSSPHAYDDEFTGVSLDPKWTRRGNWDDVNAIDPYAGFATPQGGRWSMNSYRKSWFMVQPDTSTGTGSSAEIFQAVSLPTDCTAWARLSFNCRFNAVVANDSRIGLTFHASSGGLPDDSNRSFIFLNLPGTNTIVCAAGRVTGGVTASSSTQNVGPQTLGTDSKTQTACYVCIQKAGSTYTYLLGWPNGHWIYLAQQTQASTMAFLTLTFINTSTATPGNMLMGCDFVRFKAGIYTP